MAVVRNFDELEVWKMATELRRLISQRVKSFPEKEKYLLSKQMLRASRSVTNNISAGYGRFHYQENIQFSRQSRGSVSEIMDDLIIALDEGYISTEDFNQMMETVNKVLPLLNGYINYLMKAKKESTSMSNEEIAEYSSPTSND